MKRGAKRRVEGKELSRRKEAYPTPPPCYFFPYSLYFAPSRLSENLEQANHERVTFSVRNDTTKSEPESHPITSSSYYSLSNGVAERRKRLEAIGWNLGYRNPDFPIFWTKSSSSEFAPVRLCDPRPPLHPPQKRSPKTKAKLIKTCIDVLDDISAGLCCPLIL